MVCKVVKLIFEPVFASNLEIWALILKHFHFYTKMLNFFKIFTSFGGKCVPHSKIWRENSFDKKLVSSEPMTPLAYLWCVYVMLLYLKRPTTNEVIFAYAQILFSLGKNWHQKRPFWMNLDRFTYVISNMLLVFRARIRRWMTKLEKWHIFGAKTPKMCFLAPQPLNTVKSDASLEKIVFL